MPLAHWTITGSPLTMATRAVLEPQRAPLFVLRQVRVRLPFVRMWDVILIIMGMIILLRRGCCRLFPMHGVNILLRPLPYWSIYRLYLRPLLDTKLEGRQPTGGRCRVIGF